MLADFLLNSDIDESRLELFDGEGTEKPMPNIGLSRVALRIGSILDKYGDAGVEARAVIEAANASPLPDVYFYREGLPGDLDYMRVPPTWRSKSFHRDRASRICDEGRRSL